MRTLLIIVAAVLLVFWLLSVLVFAVGQLAHVLLVLAIVAFLFSRWKKRRSRNELSRRD